MANDIYAKNGLLVGLSAKCLGWERKDDHITRAVQEQHGVGDDAGGWRKWLLPKSLVHGPQEIVRKARTILERLTVAWGTKGMRYLPLEHYDVYTERLEKLKGEFDKAVEDLQGKVPQYIEDQKQRLSNANDGTTLYREEDYSHLANIAPSYDFIRRVQAVPKEGDLIVDLVGEELDKLNADAAATRQVSADAAKLDLAKRLAKCAKVIDDALKGFSVTRVRKSGGKYKNEATRNGAPGARLAESMITNLQDLIEIADGLNVTGDADLRQAIADVRDGSLVKYDVDDLRDPTASDVVEQVRSDASDLAAKMAGFIGADDQGD